MTRARRVLRAAVRWGLGLIALSAVLIVALGLMAPRLWPERPLQADLIVVLGGYGPVQNNLLVHGHDRVETGARLFAAGVAPRLLMTGIEANRTLPGGGDPMTELAAQLGVPRAAILREKQSQSTLQNALFSRRMLGGDFPPRIVLVTDSFHLARAWASFRWAGAQDIALVATRDFGQRPLGFRAKAYLREVAAWWFNLARLAVWEAGALLGAEPPDMLLY